MVCLVARDYGWVRWNIYSMENQKAKLLKTRIDRQSSILAQNYTNYERLFHKQSLGPALESRYVGTVKELLMSHNSFVGNLHDCLEKRQVQLCLGRTQNIAMDLLERFRQASQECQDYRMSCKKKGAGDVCMLCRDSLQSNKIESLKREMEAQAECRSLMIQRIIEESEKERTRPLFSETEERQFKEELDRALINKEIFLQRNHSEGDLLLRHVEENMTQMMLGLKHDVADWEHRVNAGESSINVREVIKEELSRKLKKSFEARMPNWIKHMEEVFLERKVAKEQARTVNRGCQTNDQYRKEQMTAKKQIEELKDKLSATQGDLTVLQEQLKFEKIRSKNTYEELEKMENYYLEKLFEISKQPASKEDIILQIINQRSKDPEMFKPPEESTEEEESRAFTKKKYMRMMMVICQGNSGKKDNIRPTPAPTGHSRRDSRVSENSSNKENEANDSKKTTKKDLDSIAEYEKQGYEQYEGELEETLFRTGISYKGDKASICKMDGEISSKPQQEGKSKGNGAKNWSMAVNKLKKKGYLKSKREDMVRKSVNHDVSAPQIRQDPTERNKKESRMRTEVNRVSEEMRRGSKEPVNKQGRHNQSMVNLNPKSLPKQRSSKMHEGRKSYNVPAKTSLAAIEETNNGNVGERQQSLVSIKHVRHDTDLTDSKQNRIPEQIQSQTSEQSALKPKKVVFPHQQQQSIQISQENQHFQEIVSYLSGIRTSHLTLGNDQKRQLLKLINKAFTKHNSKPRYMMPIGSQRTHRSRHSQGPPQQFSPTVRVSKSIMAPEDSPRGKHKAHSNKKNQSMHLGQFHLPSIVGQTSLELGNNTRSRIKTGYVSLFVNEKVAQSYEDSLSQPGQRNAVRPSPSQLNQIEKLYTFLESLKARKPQIYNQIGFCLRFPFTFKSKGMPTVPVNVSLTFSSFNNYLMRILWYHRACASERKEPFCEHVMLFTRTIEGLAQVGPIESQATLKEIIY